MAFVLAPELPVADWLAEFDAQLERSPAFFAGRPVIVDVSALPASDPGLAELIEGLRAREIQVIAVESAEPAWLGVEVGGLPAITSAGRSGRPVEVAELVSADTSPSTTAPQPRPVSLLIDEPIRSGQSIVFPTGDVIVVGSVASGAEVIAGGSIHVYGVVRGRAIAGSMGNARARIFCRRLEAELLAIDGLYKTADNLEPRFHGRAIQAWLEGDALMMAALD